MAPAGMQVSGCRACVSFRSPMSAMPARIQTVRVSGCSSKPGHARCRTSAACSIEDNLPQTKLTQIHQMCRHHVRCCTSSFQHHSYLADSSHAVPKKKHMHFPSCQGKSLSPAKPPQAHCGHRVKPKGSKWAAWSLVLFSKIKRRDPCQLAARTDLPCPCGACQSAGPSCKVGPANCCLPLECRHTACATG